MSGRRPARASSKIRGIGYLVLALFLLSLQNIAIKWISGDYPVLEIVIFRNIIAMPSTLLLFRLEGRRGLPTTKRHHRCVNRSTVRGWIYRARKAGFLPPTDRRTSPE